VVELVALNQVARRVPQEKPINANHTGVVHDALNQVAMHVPETKQKNA
jgi:hypothetical protein